jgi:hypothetical protein
VGLAIRKAMLLSESAALLLAIMVLGGVALWVGTPVVCLWLGSMVQAGTGSVGAALLAMLAGLISCTALLASVLVRLDHRHVEVRAARGADVRGASALERVLVASGVLALLAFAMWFALLSGSSPFPGLEVAL